MGGVSAHRPAVGAATLLTTLPNATMASCPLMCLANVCSEYKKLEEERDLQEERRAWTTGIIVAAKALSEIPPSNLEAMQREWQERIVKPGNTMMFLRALSINMPLKRPLGMYLSLDMQEAFWCLFWHDVIFKAKMEILQPRQRSKHTRLMDPKVARSVLVRRVWRIANWDACIAPEFEESVYDYVRKRPQLREALSMVPPRWQVIE